MTPAQRFGKWLKEAMREAGLDVDSQRGGGRATLAEACGVSRSTVGRWLDGETMPGHEHFSSIAKALKLRPVEVFVGAGMLSPDDLPAVSGTPSPVRTRADIEEVGRQYGIADDKLPLFVTAVKSVASAMADPEAEKPASQ